MGPQGVTLTPTVPMNAYKCKRAIKSLGELGVKSKLGGNLAIFGDTNDAKSGSIYKISVTKFTFAYKLMSQKFGQSQIFNKIIPYFFQTLNLKPSVATLNTFCQKPV